MSTTGKKITALTVAAAAQELGCTTAGIYYLLKQGVLERFEGVQGRAVLVTSESVERAKHKPRPTAAMKARRAVGGD